VNDTIDEYEASDQWTAVEGKLACDSKHLRFAYWKGELPTRFRYEAHIDGSKVSGAVGLLFGGNSESVQLLVAVPETLEIETAKLAKEIDVGEKIGDIEAGKEGDIVLAMEVRENEVEFFLDGVSLKVVPYEPDDLKGMIGAFSDGGKAAFTQMRLRW
jgi:hypothetical protein